MGMNHASIQTQWQGCLVPSISHRVLGLFISRTPVEDWFDCLRALRIPEFVWQLLHIIFVIDLLTNWLHTNTCGTFDDSRFHNCFSTSWTRTGLLTYQNRYIVLERVDRHHSHVLDKLNTWSWWQFSSLWLSSSQLAMRLTRGWDGWDR